MQITRLSKASWFKIKTKNKIIHIDPGYTGYFESQNIPLNQLEDKADLILITHFHKDHLQPKVLEMIRDTGTAIFAPKSCVERISGKITIVKPGDQIKIGKVIIKTVAAYNTLEGKSTRKVHHQGEFVGYLLTVDGKTLYHAGDTDLIPEMRELGSVDLALLPIGGTFVMDVDEAVKATQIINPKVVIPMHSAKVNPDEFKEKNRKVSHAMVVILNTGDTYNFT